MTWEVLVNIVLYCGKVLFNFNDYDGIGYKLVIESFTSVQMREYFARIKVF